jgi:chemotaxis protein MotB
VTIQLSEAENRMIDMMQMGSQIQRAIATHGLKEDAEVTASEDGVILKITGTLMFPIGSAKINAEFEPFLETIAKIIRENDYPVAIEGHTDNIPIANSPLYPSNWELSSARATAVLRYLVERQGIDPKRLMAVGYADTRPLVPNDTPENRAKNRRVEFHFKPENDAS